jgi:probable rRNA maturation factor
MDVCEAVRLAALRTMILLDPDLDPDPAPEASKGATLHDSPQLERHRRMPSVRTLGLFLREAQAAVRLRGLVSVLLTTDTEIRRLNRTFRRKNKATDVLSFPAGEASRGSVAGDLAISIPTARRQAAEQGHALAVEVKVLMLHGLLHLAGYDHEADEGQMARRERVLRARLRLPRGLIERVSSTILPTEKSRKNGARAQSESSSHPTHATRRSRMDGARRSGVRA